MALWPLDVENILCSKRSGFNYPEYNADFIGRERMPLLQSPDPKKRALELKTSFGS